MPDDIITPQDTLEPVAQATQTPTVAAQAASASPQQSVQVPPQPPTSTQPAQMPQTAPAPPPRLPSFLSNKLIHKIFYASLAVLGLIALLVGVTLIYQRTHKTQLTQTQKVSQVKDQSVQLKNASANTGLPASLQGKADTLYVNGNVAAQGNLALASGSNQAQLGASNLSADQSYLLPNASGTICLDSNNCGYATAGQVANLVQNGGGVSSLQGTSGQVNVSATSGAVKLSLPQSIGSTSTPTFSSIKLTNTGTQGGSLLCDASNNCGYAMASTALLQGGNSFGSALQLGTLDSNALDLLTNGSVVASFSNSGQASFQNSSDSSSALQVLNAASDSIFTVDTTNNKVILGASSSSPTVLTLGIKTDSSDPAGVDGDIYYNSALGKFRCHQAGAWTNCNGSGGVGTGDVNNGGNNYGGIMTIGTLDNHELGFLVNGNAVGAFDTNGSFYVLNSTDNQNGFAVENSSGGVSLNVSTLNDSLYVFGGVHGGYNSVLMHAYGSGDYASTPNAASNQITGNIEMYARVRPDNWCATNLIIAKTSAYNMLTFGCKLAFNYSHDGSVAGISAASSVNLPFANGQDGWVRLTYNSSTGDVTFYYADSQTAVPTTWTQLGSVQSITASSIYPSTNAVLAGASTGDTFQAWVLDGIGGTPVIFFNAADAGGSTSWSRTVGSITNNWSIVGAAKLLGDTSTIGGKLGIATSSPTSLLTVNDLTTTAPLAQAAIATGAAANQGLVLQGASSQTADLLQNQASNGTTLSGFNGYGGLYVNAANAVINSLTSPNNYCPFVVCPSMSTTGGSLATGTYYYTVTAVNAAGTEATPAKTISLTATTNTSTANLGWVDTTGAVKYKVYRSTSSSFGSTTLLATVSATTDYTYYTDTGAATAAGTPPTTTTGAGLTVQAWDNQSKNAIEVQNSGGATLAGINSKGGIFSYGTNDSLTGLASPSISVTGFTLLGSLAANTYYYGVTAVNSTGETALTQATQSVVTTGSTSSVKITWPTVPGATSYNVYRSSASTGGAKFGATSFLQSTTSTTYWDYGGVALTSGRPSSTTTGTTLNLQGWANQTGNILQVQDSSGTSLTTVGANGSLNVTGGATIAAASIPVAVSLNGLTSSFNVSTPDAAANQITGDMSGVVRASLSKWGNGQTSQTLMAKYDGVASDSSYIFSVTSGGYLQLKVSVGGSFSTATSTVPLSLASNAAQYVYFTRSASTGQVGFYTSSTGNVLTFAQLGANVSTTSGALNAGNQPVQVGVWGTSDPLFGKVYLAEMFSDIARTTLAYYMRPIDASSTASTSWNSSLTGETWTLSGTAALVGASSQVTVSSTDSATSGITIQGASGQVANMLQAVNSSGTVLFNVDYLGGIHATGNSNGIGGTAINNTTLGVFTTADSHVGLAVRGTASQTANLQEWQNSSGTVIASVNASGVGSFANLLQNSNQVCDDSNNCGYLTAGGGSYTQNGVVYFDGTNLVSTAAGSSGQCLVATLGAPSWSTCASGSGSGDINQGGNSFGTAISLGATDNYGLNLLANNTVVASFSASGAAVFQNATNSTSGFQIQNAAGDSLFTADSTNSVIYIGNPTPDSVGTLLVLDNKNTTGDPTGIDGAMYYNSFLGKFRCYQDGAWTDCVSNSQVVTKAADQAVTSTSYGNLSDLSFAVVSGKSYSLTCSLLLTVPVGGGFYLSTSAPGGQFTSSFLKTGDQSAGDNYATSTTLSDPSPSSISKITSQTGTRFLLNYNALLSGVTSTGTWQLVGKSATGASITVAANSSCRLQPL